MSFLKKSLIIFTFLVTIFSLAGSVAALEVDYPSVGSDSLQITSGSDIIDYVKYAFIFLVATAGIFGVISITISGFIILASAGNPAMISAARERIFGSILGIGLLMFSYIILRTINPQLIGEEFHPDPTGAVYYIVDNPDWSPEFDDLVDRYLYKPAPQAELDVYNNVIIGINSLWQNPKLYYSCDPDGPDPKKILVWSYNQTNLKFNLDSNSGISDTEELPCIDVYPRFGSGGNVIDLNWGAANQGGVKSFKWEYKEPGVYFYLTDDCTGVSTSVQKITGAIKKFGVVGENQSQGAPKSLKIINGTNRKEKYGVILTEKISSWLYKEWDVGFCASPIVTGFDGLSGCYNNTDSRWGLVRAPDERPLNPTSAFILKIDIQVYPEMGTVTFSNDYKLATISHTTINSRVTQSPFYFIADPINNSLSSFGVHNFNKLFRAAADGDHTPFEVMRYRGTSDGYIHSKECPYGKTCLENITFKRGAYYVIIYATNSNKNVNEILNKGGLSTCQVFNESVFGIKSESFLEYSRDIWRTIIIPSSNYLK